MLYLKRTDCPFFVTDGIFVEHHQGAKTVIFEADRLGTLYLLQSECAQFVLLKMILIKNYLDNFSERNCFYEKSRNNYGQ